MLSQILYRSTTSADENAPPERARAYAIQLVSLGATKVADGLIDPKLVLSWLLTSIGAPGGLIGALVPVREAGSLLPQLALARVIEKRRQRKQVWAIGSAVQGIAALVIAWAVLSLDGAPAGWVVILALAVLACARSACSASSKDILSRTLEKGTRGSVSGTAGSAGAVLIFTYAVLLGLGVIPREPTFVALGVAVAGGLWILAALVFLRLDEPEADPDAGGFDSFAEVTRPLRHDPQFRSYLGVRALLISTALAPPFLVLLSGTDAHGGLGNLGLFMIASSLAAIVSSYVWGRLSDRSSRKTLAAAGLLSSACFAAAAALGIISGGLGNIGLASAFIFVAQVAYQGARQGRKTHLTDMETPYGKATYTALSNSLIGVLLLLGGGFGLLADYVGATWVLAIFAVMSLAALPVALGLDEVQHPDEAEA